jgi:hypothetical protein
MLSMFVGIYLSSRVMPGPALLPFDKLVSSTGAANRFRNVRAADATAVTELDSLKVN